MASYIPNGRQQFFDGSGSPLAAGSVYFYVPGTTTPKATYQDTAQTVANTNPITLDAGGFATIYGNGSYRQVVFDVLGNQIWDTVVTSPFGNASTSITSGSSFSVTTGGVVLVNKTTGSPTLVTLSSSIPTGSTVTVKDKKGDAFVNPITIQASGLLIDGLTSYFLNANNNSISLYYDGSSFSVI